ncbi:MAG: hypothetical protein ACLQBD_00030 [Syntrophobacteraceae bacterium]
MKKEKHLTRIQRSLPGMLSPGDPTNIHIAVTENKGHLEMKITDQQCQDRFFYGKM